MEAKWSLQRSAKRTPKTILFWLALVVLTGCGKQRVDVDPEFAPYVTRFEQKSTEYGRPIQIDDLVIKFGKVDNNTDRGYCLVVEGESPQITINRDIWNTLDDAGRELTVFHELGHCVLGREHTQSTNADGEPVSIMYPYAISGAVYVRHEGSYLQELFRQTRAGSKPGTGI